MHTKRSGAQRLEDLATEYWKSEALFTAVELNLFGKIEAGAHTVAALAEQTQTQPAALTRFLHLLEALELVSLYETGVWNSPLAARYLVPDAPESQCGNIRWRAGLKSDWATLKQALTAGGRVHFPPVDTSETAMAAKRRDYLTAMDAVLEPKLKHILALLPDTAPTRILDVGCGSGAFAAALLAQYPQAEADLVDIQQMIPITQAMRSQASPETAARMRFLALNILEPWNGQTEYTDKDCLTPKSSAAAANTPTDEKAAECSAQTAPHQLHDDYELIVLSNIVHAYADTEMTHVLAEAAAYLAPNGLILIHDFFSEHEPVKAALSDINMFVNTYNGKIYPASQMTKMLNTQGLSVSPLLPLAGDTALLFASKKPECLQSLKADPIDVLAARIQTLGFDEVIPIDPKTVVTDWFTVDKCSYGCTYSGSKKCEHHQTLVPPLTKEKLAGYTKALLLKGQPPTADFQKRALEAEITAFKDGCYKAFVYWAGPCSLCGRCDPESPCLRPNDRRPSMEGAGIDVFATVHAAGKLLETLAKQGELITYYALLLVE